jgi:pyruvate/2-oxoglutarate dehydrogenase complex dihydrolipoamide acyltransferase (E2) component
MPYVMVLPKIGVNMTEATIVEWKVREGDAVREGAILFEAETDKAVQTFESSVSGVLRRILAPAGTTVQCQQPVAEFDVEAGG